MRKISYSIKSTSIFSIVATIELIIILNDIDFIFRNIAITQKKKELISTIINFEKNQFTLFISNDFFKTINSLKIFETKIAKIIVMKKRVTIECKKNRFSS